MNPHQIEIAFTPVDNVRLANLCGVLDENLKQVETALDVVISRRGEHFSVRGEQRKARLAVDALKSFYDRARNHLSVEDVQLGLIEVANANPQLQDGGRSEEHTS